MNPATGAKYASVLYTIKNADPKAKTLDYKYTQGNNPIYPGTYELTGDTLKVCCNLKGNGSRPTTAESGPDVYLWTLKRVKTEGKK